MRDGTVAGRERPPLGRFLAYRFFWKRLPDRWSTWAEADLRSESWPLRQALWQFGSVVITLTIMALVFAGFGWSVSPFIGPTIGAAVGTIISWRVYGERRREEMLRYQRGERGYPLFIAPQTKAQRGFLIVGLVLLGGGLLVMLVTLAVVL
jgi:hypothetical protein